MIRFFFILCVISLFTQCASNSKLPHVLLSDTIQIRKDMEKIVQTDKYRNYKHVDALDSVAAFIETEFRKVSDSVSEQSYFYIGNLYKNIICSINTDKQERIVIGAHYDVCGDQDGADDNASGVVGLLQLARLLKNENLNYRIDFVAYTLEEPPFFRTEMMGSHVHAKYLFDHNIKVKGMICLEMIGYFSDEPDSQDYPIGLLSWFYGSKGDYITVVQKFGNGSFGNEIKDLMKKQNLLPTKSFKAPASLPGVDFSDHQNYWKYGYSAVMITNTAFFRNKNYHEKTDQIGTIDFKRLAYTVDELYLSLKQLK